MKQGIEKIAEEILVWRDYESAMKTIDSIISKVGNNTTFWQEVKDELIKQSENTLKDFKDISTQEWSDLAIYVTKKIFGDLKYPYSIGLNRYFEEVIALLMGIKSEINKTRIPVLTFEFLPYFVVEYLKKNNFKI